LIRLSQNTHRLPIPHPTAEPTTTGRLTRILPADTLAALYSAGHSHGVTVFSLLWAAMTLSILRVNPPPDPSQPLSIQNIISPVNVRQNAGEDPNDKSTWTARLSIAILPYALTNIERFIHDNSTTADSRQMMEDVWVIAKEVHEQTTDFKKHLPRTAVWMPDFYIGTMSFILAALGSDPVNPTGGIPMFISSLGVVDKYLAQFRRIGTGANDSDQLIVKSPRMGLCLYTPSFGSPNLNHSFTWGGELIMGFSFPEAKMGSLEEQEKELKDGTRKSSVLGFVNKFVEILNLIARSNAPA